MAEMAEKKPKPNYPKKNRKPRVSCVKNTNSAKDVRINLRRAKFRTKRVSNDENEESQPRLPAPQPKMRLLPCEESEKDEESEEEFLSYVKLSVSDDRNYDLKDQKNCKLGCCKSCGLFSHDLTLLDKNDTLNTQNEHKHDENLLSETKLMDILNSSQITQNNDENASKCSNISETLEYDKRTKPKSINLLNDSENVKKTNNDKLNCEIENLEGDLDFLLTLKEPVVSKTTLFSEISVSKVKEPTFRTSNVPTKSVDLEKWLDSVLDV